MMANVSFEVRRFPCMPKPIEKKALVSKSEILANGGSFYRFSINGCSSSAELEEYLLSQYGLSEGTIISAIDVMSETEDQNVGIKTRDVWGVYEVVGSKETITFTGFAYTEEELARKSEIFLARSLSDLMSGTTSLPPKPNRHVPIGPMYRMHGPSF